MQKKKCSQHSGQELDLVCTTCNYLPVCAKCLLVGTHKGHDHIALEEYPLKNEAILSSPPFSHSFSFRIRYTLLLSLYALMMWRYDAAVKKKVILHSKRTALSSRLKPMAESYDGLHNSINRVSQHDPSLLSFYIPLPLLSLLVFCS